MANNHSELEKRLWEAADDLRANSKLKSAEYSVPVLGLIFLRYADHKFGVAEKKLKQQGMRDVVDGQPILTTSVQWNGIQRRSNCSLIVILRGYDVPKFSLRQSAKNLRS